MWYVTRNALSGDQVSYSRPPQSKLKRTKQFYVPQYEALKALTAPEVRSSYFFSHRILLMAITNRNTKT